MRRRLLLSIAFAGITACQGGESTRQIADPTSPASQTILDGSHSGNPDFFFLPPMVADASASPDWEANAFNPNLTPTVTICKVGLSTTTETQVGTLPCGPTVATFNLTSANVSLAKQLYQVDWQVPVNDQKFYRVTVTAAGQTLGAADIETARNLASLRNANTGEVIPLADGSTLPIKFRIETNVLCNRSTPNFCSLPVNLSSGGTVQTQDEDPEGIVIPPGAGTGTVVITVQSCDNFNDRVTDLPTFGPCVRVTSNPALPGSGFAALATVFICEVDDVVHAAGLTASQERRVTLHRLDDFGTSTQRLAALPHAAACGGSHLGAVTPTFGGMLASLKKGEIRKAIGQAAGMLGPKPAYAAMFIDLGGGGFTDELSDFQFALPSKLTVDAATDGQTGMPGGNLLPAVQVTDLGGEAVAGARVRFDVTAGAGTVGTPNPVVTDATGRASVPWTLGSTGANTLKAWGRGLAGTDNNGPRAGVDPFQPIQSPFDVGAPTGDDVSVLTGAVLINANAVTSQTVCSAATTTFVSAVNAETGLPIAGAGTFLIAPNTSYGTALGGSSWIGPFANSGTTNVPVGTYTYQAKFNGGPSAALSGQIMSDNGATILLNATQLLQMGAYDASIAPVTAAFQTPTPFSGGTVTNGSNTVTLKLFNSGFSPNTYAPNPAGMSFCFTVAQH